MNSNALLYATLLGFTLAAGSAQAQTVEVQDAWPALPCRARKARAHSCA